MSDTMPRPAEDVSELAAFAFQPVTVRDAIELRARLDALERWIKARKGEVAGWLDVKADAVEADTGAAANWPVAGLGRAYRTDPQPKARVSDREAFATWYASQWPSQVEGVVGVEVVDHHAASRALAHLQAVAGDLRPSMVPTVSVDTAALRDIVDGLRVVTDTVLPEGAVDWLTDVKGPRREDGTARFAFVPIEDGHLLIDLATGEDVPGVTVSVGTPTVTVKVDTPRKAELDAQLAALLPTPLPAR